MAKQNKDRQERTMESYELVVKVLKTESGAFTAQAEITYGPAPEHSIFSKTVRNDSIVYKSSMSYSSAAGAVANLFVVIDEEYRKLVSVDPVLLNDEGLAHKKVTAQLRAFFTEK